METVGSIINQPSHIDNNVDVHENSIKHQNTEAMKILDSEDKVEHLVKVDSKKEVESLVEQLNDAIAPMSTNIKFGVDRDDIFYVSVIESETDRMIRRFPAEKAASFLSKMQEVTGILFDSKG